jgi:hypothetical protein
MNNIPPGGPVTASNVVNPNDYPNMKCVCGNDIFVTVQNLKYLSQFITGTPKPAGIKVEMNCCLGCGILYPAVMDQVEIEKYASHPEVKRLNFEGVFAKLMQKILMGVNMKTEKEVRAEKAE